MQKDITKKKLQEHPDVFAYIREYEGQKLLVAANFHGETVDLSGLKELPDMQTGRLLLHNYPDMDRRQLRPYEAYMVLL